MNKKRLLELAGVSVNEQELIDRHLNMKSLVNYFSERILDSMIDHYYELRQTNDVEGESHFIELVTDPEMLDDQFDYTIEKLRRFTLENVKEELPKRLKQARRELVAQKRQRRE